MIACIGTPISWLRLETYAAGEGAEAERAEIAAHLGACEACKGCLATIEADARPLPVRSRSDNAAQPPGPLVQLASCERTTSSSARSRGAKSQLRSR